MASKLDDAAAKLGVIGEDFGTLKKQRRRDVLTRVAQSSMVIVSALLGLVGAQIVCPARPYVSDTYPFIPIILSSMTLRRSARRTWIVPIVLSAAVFIVNFTFMAIANNEVYTGYFGPTTKYSVFSGNAGEGSP